MHIVPRLRQICNGRGMSPKPAREQLGGKEPLQPAEEPTTLASSMQPIFEGGTGLRALSAEDKARIGKLIKVLAKERRDKEELREQLGHQACRVQDLEREREVSQKKEAELVARVARSLDLLRTYQLEASGRRPGQGDQMFMDSEDDSKDQAVRTSPELPPLPQLGFLKPQVAESEGPPCNALQTADPLPSEAVHSARQPANPQLVFALKPPQLSLLQRYLSIQDGEAVQQDAKSPRQLQVRAERSHASSANAAVQTAVVNSFKKRSEARSLSPPTAPVKDSLQSSSCRRLQASPGYASKVGEPQRLRLGRWTRTQPQAEPLTPPQRARRSFSRTRSMSSERLTRTFDVPSEPLLGSPLPTASSARQIRNSRGPLESLIHWPLRLDSYYAPHMFDVIDSLESSGGGETSSAPPSISEELRRLQQELVSIEKKVSQGPTAGSVRGRVVKEQARGEPFDPDWRPLETLHNISFNCLGETPGLADSPLEESQELSEIDDVLQLLRHVKPT
ncbi:Uncharacterized protein SCF082_LOCUS51524 [Durusdinium trenchii]|uniref:Uncharacterized protein n=1 Tax=Durusdinium trenchii TaxID=1381693 RepID=A0ABP0SF26_9DINO